MESWREELYQLYHYGVKGQKWGVRKDRKKDAISKKYEKIAKRSRQISGKGSEKDDIRWLVKNRPSIKAHAYNSSKSEIDEYTEKFMKKYYGQNGIDANRLEELSVHMAEIMNTKVSDLRTPSGRAVAFIYKKDLNSMNWPYGYNGINLYGIAETGKR
jgi:hypothetical protein